MLKFGKAMMNTTSKRQGKIRAKSQDVLAQRYQVSRRSIENWLLAGAPRRCCGFYNLKDWDAWFAKYKAKEGGADTLAGITLEIKREELLERRRLREVFERKMVDGETVRKEAFAAAKQITAIITRIPPQIGSILGVEAQRRAQIVVQEALEVLKENPLGEISS